MIIHMCGLFFLSQFWDFYFFLSPPPSLFTDLSLSQRPLLSFLPSLYLSLYWAPAIGRLWGCGQDHSAEVEDMLAEGVALKGVPIRGVKELLTEPSVRWQLLTILCTATTLQLCGINAVRQLLKPSYNNLSYTHIYIYSFIQCLCVCVCFQVYLYSFDVFSAAGIPNHQLRYVALGTGLCEIVTSITCVSLPLFLSCPDLSLLLLLSCLHSSHHLSGSCQKYFLLQSSTQLVASRQSLLSKFQGTDTSGKVGVLKSSTS